MLYVINKHIPLTCPSGAVRAELPVSTLDWQSNSRGQFIPVNGLDFLIGVSKLLIQQTVELTDR